MTQNQNILQYLKAGNRITPLEALNKFGSLRLGARIHDLKRLGYNIQKEIKTQGKQHFAEYYLVQE